MIASMRVRSNAWNTLPVSGEGVAGSCTTIERMPVVWVPQPRVTPVVTPDCACSTLVPSHALLAISGPGPPSVACTFAVAQEVAGRLVIVVPPLTLPLAELTEQFSYAVSAG